MENVYVCKKTSRLHFSILTLSYSRLVFSCEATPVMELLYTPFINLDGGHQQDVDT